MDNILVIKLSALGDFVQATGAMKAIRDHHQGARITLLTTKTYAEWGRESGWFDDVLIDARPKIFDIKGILDLRRKLRAGNFTRVYDLQGSDRSHFYALLFLPRMPEWNGILPFCSHPDKNPLRAKILGPARHRAQLQAAGILNVPDPDLSWIAADISRFHLPESFALLVPGAAAARPGKRWSSSGFIEVASHLLDSGVTPVLLGAKGDAEAVHAVKMAVPGAISLLGQTDFSEIVALGRLARLAVGNDTGPMHLLAAAGCPMIVLFSGESNPQIHAPTGENVRILRETSLKDLPVERVIATISALITT